MSGNPSQQPPVCTCDECGQQKKTATRGVTFSSTTKDSETKHRQGSADFGDFSGGTDRKNTEMASTGSTVTRKEDFYICPTPGCVQRKKDRWGARRWELKNDPNLDDSLENQNQEIERIDEEEERHRRQTGEFSSEDHTSNRHEIEGKEKKYRQREENEYHNAGTINETTSSRQSARNSTRQSDRQSRDDGTRSQQSDEQTTADGWGTADSTQSDQQTTANGWGATDADRTSNRSRTNRDTFRGDVDARTSTTQTGNDVFADNVYDEETETDDETASKRDAFQDATDSEALDDDTTETHNRSWSQSWNR